MVKKRNILTLAAYLLPLPANPDPTTTKTYMTGGAMSQGVILAGVQRQEEGVAAQRRSHATRATIQHQPTAAHVTSLGGSEYGSRLSCRTRQIKHTCVEWLWVRTDYRFSSYCQTLVTDKRTT